MKKFVFSLALTNCICMSAYSQATSMIVDCQTPGWLSSKINYGDQQSVTDLTITGFLNSDDFKFIGSLMKLHSLKRLDVEHVDVVSSDMSMQNILPINMFDIDYPYECHVEKIVLPLSVNGFLQSQNVDEPGCFSNWLYVDTLVIGGPAMPIIKNSLYGKRRYGSAFSTQVKYLILREGVESIADACFLYNYRQVGFIGSIYDVVFPSTINGVVFPSSLKKIGALAFCGNEFTNLILPDGLEEIGMDAFKGTSMKPDTLWRPDTLRLPSSIKKFNISAFNQPSKVYYFPESIEEIDNRGCSIDYINGTRDLINGGMSIEIHLKRTIPPTFNSDLYILKNSTIYVPSGAASKYRNTVPWKEANIIEEIYVEGISLPNNKSLYVGEKNKLQIQIQPLDATNKNVIWQSSNDEVITVSEDGTLNAISSGTAEITAITIDGGFKATCRIDVYEHTTGIEMIDIVSIPVGAQYELNAQTLPISTSDGKIDYRSHNTNIATVSETGSVLAIAKGTCTITATSVDGGYTAQCLVSVIQPVEAVTIEKHSLSLKVGETESLYAQVSPATADDKAIAWSSSDEQTATVDANGEVKALKSGEAWIKAISKDNEEAKDSCKVTVTQPVTGITLSQEDCQMNEIGESVQLEATILPADATNKEVRWKSSDESVCVVGNGKVVATGYGTAVVMAISVEGSFIATCKVTVKKPAPLIITANSYSREYGESNPVFDYTISDSSIEGSPTITCEATPTSPAGTYPIVVSQGDIPNGNVSYVNGTLTITKAPLTIKAGEYTKEQGEENPEFTLTYEGFRNNETSTVLIKQPTVTTTAVEDSPIGEYDVIVSGAEAQNYEITYVNGKLTIIVPVGINEVDFEKKAVIYNLSGQRLSQPQRGVNIIDGKKVIVK